MNVPNKQIHPNRSDRPALANGDRMSQMEFHRRYQSYPKEEKFELIGGVVYRAERARVPHARDHATLSALLGLYHTYTPGTDAWASVSTILGDETEVQPDVSLSLLPECGGQWHVTDEDYIEGAPELVAEIALSSYAIDLHDKRDAYQAAGVKEYIVLNLEDTEFVWFDFAGQGSIAPDKKGIMRSRVFPGLWINAPALLGDDGKALMASLNRGLKSAAHAAFVKKLGAAK
jgi:hypothetical protein